MNMVQMSIFAEIGSLVLDGMKITMEEQRVRFSGVIAMRHPAEQMAPLLRQVHEAVARSNLAEVEVDLRDVRFMNSSAIRTLVEWVDWVLCEPASRRYMIHFIANPNASWQCPTLHVIHTLGKEHVRVSYAAPEQSNTASASPATGSGGAP